MLGIIVEPEAFLEEFESGDPAAMFFAEAGLEDPAVMLEDQVDLADLDPFLALEEIVERVFAAGIAEFFVGSAAEGFAAVEPLGYVLRLLIPFLLNSQLSKITVQFRKILPQTN